jgi:miniconductance mechanosensitive channel
MAQVLAGFLGIIASVYIAIGKSPLGFISGLGAMTAVLMLIFKDTILSFIAGMQLMFNDLIHKGDWIEVPQFGADGDVVDIALYNVTVQNFDKTIVYIPTSKLMDGSFKNWRGMKEAGGRRIKRSINIDQSSIRFLHKDDIERLKHINLISDYLDSKLNEDVDADGTDPNRRKLTNVGTFRAYIINYLKAHPKIRKDLTLLVRQLPPGPEGLPIEIYVFTNDTDWIVYEGIQSDIFDHLLAAVNEFDLSVFQHPAGSDIKKLVSSS